MTVKTYRETNGKRLYRVHAMGKVETSTNGCSWFGCPIKPNQINHWKRSGVVVKIASDCLPATDPVERWTTEIERLERFLLESPTVRELIPVHPAMGASYDRKNMQTVKVCPTEARGYDEWSAMDGLKVINKGLSLPAKMSYRYAIIRVFIERLRASRDGLLARRAKGL
ncbi:hypothetical protein [Aeromonas phage 14AhydR10PP]|nr:hypothetical protein [Aeromonas phage 14AhydR10PP]